MKKKTTKKIKSTDRPRFNQNGGSSPGIHRNCVIPRSTGSLPVFLDFPGFVVVASVVAAVVAVVVADVVAIAVAVAVVVVGRRNLCTHSDRLDCKKIKNKEKETETIE